MHVKVEPNNEHNELSDMSVDIITDIESHLLREQLFGNSSISASDISESSSDDDHFPKMSTGFELFTGSNQMENCPNLWEPCSSSSRSSSTSGSFDHGFGEFEYSANTFLDVEDADMEVGTCSPHEIMMSPSELKEEPIYSDMTFPHQQSARDSDDAAQDIWDFLCSKDEAQDVKPIIKILETPPVTPPESRIQAEDSPPSSPLSIPNRVISPAPPLSLPSTAVITLTQIGPKPVDVVAPSRKVALAPKIPFKVVTTITAANENLSNQGIRTIKIQPKSPRVENSKPVISIINSSVPNVNVSNVVSRIVSGPGRGDTRVCEKPFITKPIIISSSPSSQHSNYIPTPLPISVNSSQTTTCTVIPERKTSRLPALAPALNPTLKHNTLAELRALKRQQRMIKNRESASLSRKRKKEYLQSLEDKVRELDEQNTKLRMDNEKLQRRVTALENERVIMKAARFPLKRTSVALMGFAFLFFFNITPFINVFKTPESQNILTSSWGIREQGVDVNSGNWDRVKFSHRSLLSLPPLEPALSGRRGAPAGNDSHICPININTTESIRIENELRDWFESRLDSNSKPEANSESPIKVKKYHPKTRAGRENALPEIGEKKIIIADPEEKKALAAPQLSSIPSAAYQYLYRYDDAQEPLPSSRRTGEQTDMNAVTLMAGSIQSLLESIERRNDTYYVVSLSADHILLPASSHNTSARPKMSLLVPTPRSIDETSSMHRQISLMQIDCEVTHTRLVRWRESATFENHPEVEVPPRTKYQEVPQNITEPMAEQSLRRGRNQIKRKKKIKLL